VLIVALLIVALAVVLMVRRVDVRLVLLGAGLAMATLAGRPLAVADTFARAMVATMVAPICASMGFAAVLAITGCDRHLVRLLLLPLRRARWAVLPGGIATAYLVNLAVPSQSSAAAMLGPILLPLMVAAGARRDVAGAALVLGSSFGGDLLNPGAQDVQALAGVTGLPAADLSARVIPAGLCGVAVAAVTFPLLNRRGPADEGAGPVVAPSGEDDASPNGPLRPIKAMIPLIPVALLLLAHAGWAPTAWLLRVPPGDDGRAMAGALPVVRAMLVGVLAAAVASCRDLPRLADGLFRGMGAAYGNIIALTIAAQCFGAGVAAVGLGDALLHHAGGSRGGMSALAVAFPWGLATLSGSGSGPVLAFAQVCLVPLGPRPGAATLGALTCLAAAFGRTMSPVSAVVVCGAGLVGVAPLAVVRRLLPALVLGASASLGVALLNK
jgi:C4-dicarboxylate transporter, DcuC family